MKCNKRTEKSDCAAGTSKDTQSTLVVLLHAVLHGRDEQTDTSALGGGAHAEVERRALREGLELIGGRTVSIASGRSHCGRGSEDE